MGASDGSSAWPHCRLSLWYQQQHSRTDTQQPLELLIIFLYNMNSCSPQSPQEKIPGTARTKHCNTPVVFKVFHPAQHFGPFSVHGSTQKVRVDLTCQIPWVCFLSHFHSKIRKLLFIHKDEKGWEFRSHGSPNQEQKSYFYDILHTTTRLHRIVFPHFSSRSLISGTAKLSGI